jgi:hypothetical protein
LRIDDLDKPDRQRRRGGLGRRARAGGARGAGPRRGSCRGGQQVREVVGAVRVPHDAQGGAVEAQRRDFLLPKIDGGGKRADRGEILRAVLFLERDVAHDEAEGEQFVVDPAAGGGPARGAFEARQRGRLELRRVEQVPQA